MHQRPCHSDTLTLPTRHLRWPPLPQLSKTESTKNLTSCGQRLRLALPGQAQWQRGVLLHGQLRQEFAVLEYKSEALASQRTEFFVVELTEVAALETDLSARHGQDPCETVQQRRFAGATLSSDRRDFATPQEEVDIPDGRRLSIEEIDTCGAKNF